MNTKSLTLVSRIPATLLLVLWVLVGVIFKASLEPSSSDIWMRIGAIPYFALTFGYPAFLAAVCNLKKDKTSKHISHAMVLLVSVVIISISFRKEIADMTHNSDKYISTLGDILIFLTVISIILILLIASIRIDLPKENRTVSRTIGTFILLFLFPIGIFFLQPRIRRLAKLLQEPRV